ncbi:MAG: hypothetical protein HY235_04575 [Acidobacteria bacterium]|nr:hypothetical protein [Acidobacteriota bacterium]
MKYTGLVRSSLMLALGALACSIAGAQTPTVIVATQADVSPTLAELAARALTPATGYLRMARPRLQVAPDDESGTASPGAPATAPFLQTGDLAAPRVASVIGKNFEGIGQGLGFSPCCAPPDTVGAPGLTEYVQVVNVSLGVFSKATGALTFGPVDTSALWAGFGGLCETTNNGDAVVLFDRMANRWFITQFAFNVDVNGTPVAPVLQCIAVSTTSSATGTYARYGYSFGSEFNDYGKMGVWPDGYYFAFNMFTLAGANTGIKPCVAERAKMLVADPTAVMLCFPTAIYAGGGFGMLPTDLDGPTPPPAGTPNFFIRQRTTTPRSLGMHKFHADFVTPANSTFNFAQNTSVGTLERACSGGTCITQPAGGELLDSLGDRLMHRLAYRNFGSRQILVVTQSVTPPAPSTALSGIRWFEIRDPNGAATAFQNATFAPDNNARWMGSTATDKLGNQAIGYSVSGSSVFPGIRYTARLRGEPRNLMEAEATIVNGGGVQMANTFGRWGDYSSMNIDPVDDCTFWYTQEYIKQNPPNTFNWSTRVASFKFPNCQ